MSEMNRREFGRSALAGLAFLGGSARASPPLQASRCSRVRATAYRYIHLDVFTDRRTQGNQLFVFTQPAGLDTDDDAGADARVEPLRVHVRLSAGGGGHRSSRPDLHAHGGDAVCRPPDDRHRVRPRAHRRAEAGRSRRRRSASASARPTSISSGRTASSPSPG